MPRSSRLIASAHATPLDDMKQGEQTIVPPPRMAFILSTGRTATRFFAWFFDNHFAGVHALHMPPPSRQLRVYSNLHIAGKVSRDFIKKRYIGARRGLLERLSCELYIESNNYLHGTTDALADLFPEAVMLHVVRDPRTYVESQLNFNMFHGVKGLLTEYCPYWCLKPRHYPEAGAWVWHDMTHIEKAAWRWKAINRILARFGNGYDHYLRVRFEDVFGPEHSGLGQMLDALGLTLDEGIVRKACSQKRNVSRRRRIPPWQQWQDEELERLYEICGPEMRMFGYSREDGSE